MSLRVFAALPIPTQICDAVEDLMDQVPGAKWRPRGNLHITLAFYGELIEPVIADLDTELGRIHAPELTLELSGTGHFGSNPPTSIWLGVEPNKALTQLAKACRTAGKACGIEMERRNYLPHLTLAYLPSGIDLVRVQRFEQRHGLFRSEPFKIDRFHLYASRPRKPGQPNAYTIETEYPLVSVS
jgi:2'-5' RNA ligase